MNWSETLLSNRMVIDTQVPIEKRAWLEGYFLPTGGAGPSVDHTLLDALCNRTTPLVEEKGSRGKPQAKN